MSRLSKTIASATVTVVCTAVVASPALAKPDRVTAGKVTIRQSPQVMKFLHAFGITATALAPARLGNASLTLPIVGGTINASNRQGVLDTSGGVKYIGGKLQKFRITGYRIRFTRNGGTISAVTAGVRTVIARIVPHLSVSGTTARLTASMSASRAWIRYLDAWGGTNVGTPGEHIGELSVTISIG